MRVIMDVENDPRGATALAALLGDEYRIRHCPASTEAAAAARRGEADALIVDLNLACGDAFELIGTVGRLRKGPPVIVMSASAEPRSVVRAILSGAVDFLPKPAPIHDLRLAVAKALGRLAERPAAFVGVSHALSTVMSQIRTFADWDFPLLITGESGTGKDLAAQTLHQFSARRTGAFVARNCAALPDELIESELYGSNKGAFTGASDRPGAFELAEGGTLFLDEIGEASLDVQAKLLRTLETGEVWRLGARSVTRVDFRFICATSRDLQAAVGQGSFRLDLLYRIETLRLHIPPLRERPEDVAPLARHFVLESAPGRKWLGEEALALLAAAPWPGNVRQLRNVVQRAIVLSKGREEIAEEDIVIY
jgi:DNA-binding NtrC family response regulator